jgi:hypothetical protein
VPGLDRKYYGRQSLRAYRDAAQSNLVQTAAAIGALNDAIYPDEVTTQEFDVSKQSFTPPESFFNPNRISSLESHKPNYKIINSVQRRRLKIVASGELVELVKLADYFGEVQQISISELHTDIHSVVKNVDQLPDIYCLGNLIVSAMERRLRSEFDFAMNMFNQIQTKLDNALSEELRNARNSLELLRQSNLDLENATNLSQEMRQIGYAMVIVQICRDFIPDFNLTWLPLPQETISLQRGIRSKIIKTNLFLEQLPNIAAAIELFAELVTSCPSSGYSAKQSAIDSGKLVLDRHNSEVYWDGEKIAADWRKHAVPFQTFIMLVECCLRSRKLTYSMLASEDVDPKSVAQQRVHQLKSKLPSTLKNLVKNHSGKDGGYTLDLTKDCIHCE